VGHPTQVVLILQICFIKPNKEQIVEVAGLFLKSGNDGDLQLSGSGKLIS